MGFIPPKHGYLEHWARQGVLLLNAVLSVEKGRPNSHQNKGWERFTDSIIKKLNDHSKGIVFLLWGKNAQQKGSIIDTKKHLVLKAPHPSPFSANRGFFGCRHFSKANNFLKINHDLEVDWQLPVNVN